MPKIKIHQISLLFIFLVFLFITSPVSAQNTSCDLCGWCNPKAENKPTDWNQCMQCLFPTISQQKGIDATYSGPKPSVAPGLYYPSKQEVSKNWTVFGCLDTQTGGFVNQVYRIIVAIGSGFAFLALLYGGFQILTAAGDPQKVTSGKNTVMGAILGILLIVFSLFFLKLIGLEIIKIPGFS